MPTSPRAQRTDFSLDITGRYTCNGLDEALASVGPGARPFDLIVVGGGSFGAALAQQLFANDQAQVHRILVLESGPLALPEHVQNMPLQGLGVPPATTIAQLRSQGLDGQPRAEVWGLAWHSSTPFPGLAYCLAGRSLYFGGWSPQLLNDEMPTAANAPSPWPQAVVNDLNNRYFAESAAQIGTEETNDFIFGPLQNALRQALYDGINNGAITEAIPLGNLPDHPVLRANPGANAARLRELLGNPPGVGGLLAQELRNLLKLEAPLAVQGQTLPGFFPFNKFSSMPLLMKAARSAQAEANNNDARKRLMVVPNCHVNRLQVQGGRVVAVDTNQGVVSVPANGKVVVALGTIESARLALNSFAGLPSAQRMGRNLMAHLRSNLTIRIPRGALAGLAGAPAALQAAALFGKCRHQFNGNDVGYFHMQVTAAGLGALGTDSEAELFKLIPDIDTLHRFTSASDTHVVITIRSIGEMQPQNANSFVRLDPEPDEFAAQRAFVQLQPTARDNQLWQAMDTAADQTALVLAAGGAYEVQTPAGFVAVAAGQPPSTVGGVQRRDGLGTTHHEAGTLWMGDNPAASVTDRNARFHDVTNAHALGPALQPTVGSPNPMLTSIALGRRLANHLVPLAPIPAEGPRSLFNGQNLDGWELAGQGSFVVTGGALQAVPGGDLGLLWCTTPTPRDFILRCEWRLAQADDNSGVFVRLPNPNSKDYNNTAYVAVHFGFEVQIDETGAPDGANQHRTGAIYAEPNQAFNLQPALPVGQWNAYEIRVDGPQSQTYTVWLNGTQVTQFNNPHAGRGLPSRPDAPSFIGLQAHTGNVAFRNIELQAL
jgi:choline dehydrogenase-like flavoprotein